VLDTGEFSVSPFKDQKIALLEHRVSNRAKMDLTLREEDFSKIC
jgi:hypothetical protein